ncbi:MAG TPA: hypothetical protein VE422_30555 [Terriglobia bacterium]|nr:hypothetical protein [Terriglobia bacterium]
MKEKFYIRRGNWQRRLWSELGSVYCEWERINSRTGLTLEDKKRLKEYYLQECVTPRIREALKKYFPEDFTTADQHTGEKIESQRGT